MADAPDQASDSLLTERLSAELVGRTVVRIELRRDGRELFLEFDDGGRLFASAVTPFDLSLT